MGQQSIELTRRRLLGGVATVGVAGVGAGAGTAALFADSEASTGNSLQSGTLNLTLDGSDASVTLLSEVDVAPGESGQATVTLANTGSLPGYVDVVVSASVYYENGCPGNEGSRDSTCNDPGPGEGELQDHLEVQARFQNGPDLWSGWDLAANRLGQGTVYSTDYQLAAGASDDFVLDWELPSDTGREAQSDSIEFTLTFSLDQHSDSGA